jgi:hypothetical protein
MSGRETAEHADANPLHRFVRTSVATKPMSWLYARILPRLDKAVHRLTHGRTTFAALVSGLPVIQLTTTGARTGRTRTCPLLAVRDGADIAVIASNWGNRRNPAWYHNLRTHPDVTALIPPWP